MWEWIWNLITSTWEWITSMWHAMWKDLKDIRDIVDIVFKSVTTVTTIVAGGWAYYHFIKGRVFTPRLTLSTSARQLRTQGAQYILWTIELSNVGLSNVRIASAYIRVSRVSGVAIGGVADFPELILLKTLRVLLADTWVESGETLKEQNILTLPSDQDFPVMLHFKVVAEGGSFTATTIAEPPEPGRASLLDDLSG